MAFQRIDFVSIGESLAGRAVLNEGDDGEVTLTSIVGSVNNYGLTADFSNHDLRVAGTIFGLLGGVRLGDNAETDSNNTVTVLRGGSISADLSQANLAAGLTIFGAGAKVFNAGTIEGWFGLRLFGAGSGVSRIENSGTIRGVDWAISLDLASTERVVIINTGRILGGGSEGSGFGIRLSNAESNDIVINRKYIRGDVHLGGGNDLYDGRAGTVSDLDGGIAGQGGNDRFLPGLSAEYFIGGNVGGGSDDGIDTVDFRSWKNGLRMALDGAFANTGAALGDQYIGIDIFQGSAAGGDRFRGDAAANTFYGNGGADVLDGQGGADTLVGGSGADQLIGDQGDDTFLFLSRLDGADRIMDFAADVGNHDVIAIKASGFGGGLRAGVELREGQFRLSARGNTALDRDDRFIFRQSDQTLWFDIDGKGGKGPIKIADLQAGTVLTAADLLLV